MEGRLALHNQIRNLKAQGKTIVLASHDMAEVEALCDRIAILNGGHISFCGTAAELSEKVGKKYWVHIKTQQGSNTVETENVADALLSLLSRLKREGGRGAGHSGEQGHVGTAFCGNGREGRAMNGFLYGIALQWRAGYQKPGPCWLHVTWFRLHSSFSWAAFLLPLCPK